MGVLEIVTAKGKTPTAYSDSLVYSQQLGKDTFGRSPYGVVFLGVGNEFLLTADQSNRKVTIGTGMGSIAGRQFKSESDIAFALSALTGNKYCVIYAEVNTSDVSYQTATLKLAYDSSSYPIIRSADLDADELEVGRISLWRFIYTASSSSPISAVGKTFLGKDPGRAFDVKELNGSAGLRGLTVNEIVGENSKLFLKARKADSAGGSQKLSGTSISGVLETGSGYVVGTFGSPTVIKTDMGSETNSVDVIGDYWPEHSSVSKKSYKLCGTTPSYWKAEIIGWLITMKFDKVAKWNWGFFGLGSHFEIKYTNIVWTLFTRKNQIAWTYEDVLWHRPILANVDSSAIVGSGYSVNIITLPDKLAYICMPDGSLANPEIKVHMSDYYTTTDKRGNIRYYGNVYIRPFFKLK